MKLSGAQALIKSLEMEGTEVMFGLPGGAILPVYDPLIDSSIRHILVRHEQGAGHMAEGYAHATGRPGVAMVTSGPADRWWRCGTPHGWRGGCRRPRSRGSCAWSPTW